MYTLPPMTEPKEGEKHRVVRFDYYDTEPRDLYICPKHFILRDGTIIVSRTDINGIITHANRAFVSTSGYSEAELVGSPHSIIRHPDMPRSAYADLWQTILAGQKWNGYVKNLRKDGGYYWVFATIQPLFRNGKPYSFTSVRRKVPRELISHWEKVYARMRESEA